MNLSTLVDINSSLITTCTLTALKFLTTKILSALSDIKQVKKFNIIMISNLRQDLKYLETQIIADQNSEHLELKDCLIQFKQLINLFILKDFDELFNEQSRKLKYGSLDVPLLLNILPRFAVIIYIYIYGYNLLGM